MPIVVTTDNGFLTQKNFQAFEEPNLDYVCYVCGGKIYEDVVCRVEDLPKSGREILEKEKSDDWYKIGSFKDKEKLG